jgi:UrcA family protein
MLFRFATATIILALTANAALADSQVSVDVPFGDLNLSHAQDSKILAERLETAGREVCAKAHSEVPATPRQMQDCVDAAVNIAVDRIQSSLENKLRVSLVNAHHLEAAR